MITTSNEALESESEKFGIHFGSLSVGDTVGYNWWNGAPFRILALDYPKITITSLEKPGTVVKTHYSHVWNGFKRATPEQLNKLKTGDRIVVSPNSGHSAKGRSGEVVGMEGWKVRIRNDATGSLCMIPRLELGLLKNNRHFDYNLLTAELQAEDEKSRRGWYVFNPEHGSPKVLHSLCKNAQAEATRLAKLYPEETFYVLEIVGVASTRKKVVTTNITEYQDVNDD